jgi:Tfp pilus assembly PilM family ATPase
MTKQLDISSTEKLLERIREDQSSAKLSPIARSIASVDTTSGIRGEIPFSAPSPQGVTGIARPVDAPATRKKTKDAEKKKQPGKRRPLFAFTRKTRDTVGLELKVDGIGLALVQESAKGIERTTVRCIPYETEPFVDEETLLGDLLAAPWFGPFLKNQLHRFCGSTKKPELWCGLPRESVKVHNITIPRVPDNEIASTIFWTMQKHESFDQEETIVDYDLVKEVQEDSYTKLLTIVYLARRREVEALQEIFKDIGFPLSGVSTPTVALQNEISRDYFSCEDESYSRLVVGENKSYIELYYNNTLVFSRDIKTGIASFVDSLMEYGASRGVILSEEQCRKLILVEDRKAAAQEGGYGLFTEGENDIFSLDLPAPVRLIRQMERTFDYFQNNFQIPRCNSIYLSGISVTDTRLAGYLSSEIGIPCHVHNTFLNLTTQVNISAADTRRGVHRLLPAFDIALSRQDVTRNFLVPRVMRQKQLLEAKVNRTVVLITAAVLLAASTVFYWQYLQIRGRQAELRSVTAELGRGVFTDEGQANTFLLAELGKLKEKSRQVIKLAERYLPAAVLGQISLSLPPEIKLLRLSLDDKKMNGAKVVQMGNVRKISLEGVVTGRRSNMEFILAKYIRKLTEASYIVSAIVLEKDTDTYMDKEVLTFTVQVQATVTETTMADQKKS